jgi:hypothetical protein
MPKYFVWVKFCTEVDARDEENARAIVRDEVNGAIQDVSSLEIPYVEEDANA